MANDVERIPDEEENRDAYLERLRHNQIRNMLYSLPCPECGSYQRSNGAGCYDCGADIKFLITVDLIDQRDAARDMLAWAAEEAEMCLSGVHPKSSGLKVITARIFDFFEDEVTK